jgi:hypothetical protein
MCDQRPFHKPAALYMQAAARHERRSPIGSGAVGHAAGRSLFCSRLGQVTGGPKGRRRLHFPWESAHYAMYVIQHASL